MSTGWEKRIDRQPERDSTIYKDARNSKHPNNNRVFVFGYTGTGALGIKEYIEPTKQKKPRDKQLIPKRLDFLNKNGIKIIDVACGYGFTVFIGHHGNGYKLFGCGINTDSQIGFQGTQKKPSFHAIEPQHIKISSDIDEKYKFTKISCGRAHTVAIADSNSVISFGNNSYGQCGRKIIEGELFKGSQVTNLLSTFTNARLQDVQCGQDHTMLLTDDGRIYAFGLGADGQIGQGHYNSVDMPTLIKGEIENETIVQISSKADCVLAVNVIQLGSHGPLDITSYDFSPPLNLDKGDLFGWGNSEYNQLSVVSDDTTQVSLPRNLPFKNIGKVKKAISAGSMCAILNDNGEVFVWGYGILGAGPSVTMATNPIPLDHTLFGRTDFSPESRVVDIEAGLNYFMATTDLGELYVWGKNKMGSLGIGHNNDQMFPLKAHIPGLVKKISCGVDHTVILANSFDL